MCKISRKAGVRGGAVVTNSCEEPIDQLVVHFLGNDVNVAS